MHTTQRILAAGAVAALFVPALAFAQQAQVGVRAEVRLNATTTAPRGTADGAALMANAKVRATQEIDRRTNALTQQLERINAMTRVSAEVKTSLTAQTESQLQALAALKAKIDADASATTLKADVQSIAKSYRVFAVVMPQSAITAAVDRINTIADLMTTMGTKFSARIAEASAQGKDTAAASTALADYTAKIADAKVKAAAALTLSVNLKPDNGDAALMASNKTAIGQARADIKAAQESLIAARKNINTMVNALGINVSAQAGSSAQVR